MGWRYCFGCDWCVLGVLGWMYWFGCDGCVVGVLWGGGIVLDVIGVL